MLYTFLILLFKALAGCVFFGNIDYRQFAKRIINTEVAITHCFKIITTGLAAN